jgi:hypothetical protein
LFNGSVNIAAEASWLVSTPGLFNAEVIADVFRTENGGG